MKLKEFMKNIQKIVDKHPEALDYEVVAGESYENENFISVNFPPTIGKHSEWTDFTLECKSNEFNAICIT